MSTTIKLNGVTLPGTHPNISTFVSDLPAKNLLDYWLASERTTLDGADVTAWGGFAGSTGAAGVSPTYVASLPETSLPGIVFTAGDYLFSDLVKEDGDGYLVMAFRLDNLPAASVSALGQFVLGGTDRLQLGVSNSRAAFGIGDLSFGGSQTSASTYTSGDVLVIGVHINGTTANFRVNGVVEQSPTFSGGLGGAGGFYIGGDPAFPTSMFDHTLAALAVYNGALTTEQLSAIDTQMGSYIGLSI